MQSNVDDPAIRANGDQQHVLPGMQADAAATFGEIVFGNAD